MGESAGATRVVMTGELDHGHRATSRLYRLRVLELPIATPETCRSHRHAAQLTLAYIRTRPIRDGHEWLLRRTPAALALPRGLKVSGCLDGLACLAAVSLLRRRISLSYGASCAPYQVRRHSVRSFVLIERRIQPVNATDWLNISAGVW